MHLPTEVRLEPTIREEIHRVTAAGLPILDRLHFAGDRDLEAADYKALYALERELKMGYVRRPIPGTNCFVADMLDIHERTDLLQAALGTQTAEEAHDITTEAGRTIHAAVNKGIERIDPRRFYAAQDVVRLLWRGTFPPETADDSPAV